MVLLVTVYKPKISKCIWEGLGVGVLFCSLNATKILLINVTLSLLCDHEYGLCFT